MTTPASHALLADSPAWREADALLIAIFQFTQPAFVSASPDPFDHDLARQLRRNVRSVEEMVRRTIVGNSRRGNLEAAERAENLLYADGDLEDMAYDLTLCERLGYGAAGARTLREQTAKLRETFKALRKKYLSGE